VSHRFLYAYDLQSQVFLNVPTSGRAAGCPFGGRNCADNYTGPAGRSKRKEKKALAALLAPPATLVDLFLAKGLVCLIL
jgi:hypothetical protein